MATNRADGNADAKKLILRLLPIRLLTKRLPPPASLIRSNDRTSALACDDDPRGSPHPTAEIPHAA
jgi:hypothetical protein